MDVLDAGRLETGFSSTKKQILATLKQRGSVSLADLSEGLGITKMAALKHLAILEEKGLVERSFQAEGRGRPRAYFRLSRSATRLFPEAYAHMTLCALGYIEEKLGREAVVRLLRLRAQEVYEANEARFRNKDFRRRVEELVRVREEGGYMAERGRTGRQAIEVLEHNCPILAVAERYQEACAVEKDLFQKLVQADVNVSHRVVAGDPVCRFLLRKRGDHDAAL